jgi:spore coat protein CotH
MRPLTLRRNYKWIIATVVVVALLIAGAGHARIIPYVSSFSWSIGDAWPSAEIEAPVEEPEEPAELDTLFSLDFMHEIEIEMDPSDHESMILTFEETDEKEFFHASITIDGEYFEDVGIRLKGNSTLSSSLGLGMGPSNKMSNTESDIPYLIKLNEYVSGQDYQGYEQIALRSQFKDTAMMREVLGFVLLEKIGIPAPHSTYSVVTFNDEMSLYMMTEVVVEEFVDNYLLDEDEEMGNLFKASPGAKLEYSGDDPLDYMSFEQKTNTNEEDVYQIIELAEFISNSTDEEFAQHLDDYIDIESTLKYIAFCNIIVNLDSFASNGNNYYLYQDPETNQFSVVPWDLNESFGGFWRYVGATYELDIFFENEERQGGPGGQQMQSPQNMQGGNQMMQPIAFDANPDGQFEQGMRPNKRLKRIPEGFNPPEGFEPPEGFDPDAEQPTHKVMSTQNTFITRLLETEHYKELYLDIVEDLISNELSINSIVNQVERLQAFVDSSNAHYGFWDDTIEHDYGTKELLEFIRNRFKFLSSELAGVEN